MTGDFFGVPAPVEPYKSDFQMDVSWSPGRVFTDSIEDGEEGDPDRKAMHLSAAGSEEIPMVRVASDNIPDNETFWTAVFWARQLGVPGVYRERMMYRNTVYNLGALYMIARQETDNTTFDLKTRETNYEKYGETPQTTV